MNEPTDQKRSQTALIHWLAFIVIAIAILTDVAMIFLVSSPTRFQYRIAIILACFAMSALAALLFTAKTNIEGTVGVFTLSISGAAALWLATLIVFNVVFPESGMDTGRYKLRLNLLFGQENPPNPLSQETEVRGFVQHPGDPAAVMDKSVRVDRGVGGLVANFENLRLGDKLYVITTTRDKTWRSDDVVMPTAQLRMNLFKP